tara:strand:+ start:1568 stop:2992 length:1425 start_codon:yes stop_codon:yes gene_type:complete
MTTKIPVELSSTPGIVDSSNATAITIDSSENSTFAGNIVKGNLTISGTEIDLSSGDLTLDVAGDIILDADGGDINLKDGGTVFGNFSSANNDLNISTTAQDEDIVFQGNDGGSTITALTLDMSDAGAAIFNEKVGIGTAGPTAPLHIKTSTDDAYSLRIEGATNNSANYHGIGLAGESSNTKAAILFKDIAVSYARGDMLFCLNSAADQTSATDADAVMTLKNNGDVRIGTSTSAYTFAEKLIVGDANDNDGITIQSGTTHQGNIAFNDGGTTAKGRISYQQSTNFFEFLVNNVVRLKIDANGRQAYNGSGSINAHATFVGEVGSSYKALAFERTVGGGEVGTIVANASSTTYNTSSDYRLKENIDYSWDATTRLKQLKPARFNWIADDTNTLLEGFLAHEVSSIVPEAVSGEKDAMGEALLYEHGDEIPEGKSVGDVKKAAAPEYQGIDHSKLVPLMVKTIQELEARIATLEG